VYVSFGDYDTKLSDNYVNLIPGERVEIAVQSPAQLEQLRSAMKIQTLAIAFRSEPGAADRDRR
jgi:beta-mannosidase